MLLAPQLYYLQLAASCLTLSRLNKKSCAQSRPLLHLTLDTNGNWIIELEDYKALVSDLMVSDQGYQSDAS